MDIKTFETALVMKISKELDITSNWKNSSTAGSTSIKHISKDYLLFLSDIDNTVSLIAPKMYDFINQNLTTEIYKKAIKIFNDNKILLKKIQDEETRKSLIEEFKLDSRLTKLKALDEISKTIPYHKPLENNEPEKKLELPPKKKFWKKWF